MTKSAKANNRTKGFLLIFFALILGCMAGFLGIEQTTAPVTDIPDIAQPRLSRSYIPPSEAPSSRVAIPITLTMDDLRSLAERNLVRRYDGQADFLDGSVSGKLIYKLSREGDVSVSAENGRIRISFPVRFNVRFTGSVLAAIVRVPFSVSTEGALELIITVKPAIRRDWSIKTDTDVDFAWLQSPRLNVAGIRIGLQRESEKFLREAIRDNLYRVDDAINEEIELRNRMQREWDNLSVPIMAADSVRLHFDPRAAAASQLEITEDDVTLRAFVETGITLSVGTGGDAPGGAMSARKKNLPPLEEYVSSGDETINLSVRALLNYDSLEQEAMKALSGTEIDMGVTAVSVKSLRLAGDGERLAAAVGIEAGGSGGTIYALGEPRFDERARVLSVENFELEEGTRSGLLETAAWLLRPALTEFIGGKLRWELAPVIDDLTDEARAAIASRALSDELELKGTLKSASFSSLRVAPGGIEISLNIEGAASLTYVPE